MYCTRCRIVLVRVLILYCIHTVLYSYGGTFRPSPARCLPLAPSLCSVNLLLSNHSGETAIRYEYCTSMYCVLLYCTIQIRRHATARVQRLSRLSHCDTCNRLRMRL